jgi:hypothetical protein
MVPQSESRYNLSMSRTAAQLLEEARQLPPGDFDWLVQNLLSEGDEGPEEKRFAAWLKEAGEPESGYDEWFRAGVEEALADTSGDVPHEEVVKDIANILARAREGKRLKASA